MEKMTITRGLVELKLLKKKIDNKTNSCNFVGVIQGKKDITINLVNIEEFKNNAKAELQSIKTLIERRKKIKSLIVESNAKTKVKIFDKDYTVAEAIDRKSSIEFEENLLNKLKNQLVNAESTITNHNKQIESKLDSLLGQHLSSEKKKSEDAESFTKSYNELNEYKILDPLNIRKYIKELEEEINNFKSEVDLILSESNANTYIELNT
ncbi:MAG: hypothetical protein U0457_19725 [Candidatus Sericytochromatia bacterium]